MRGLLVTPASMLTIYPYTFKALRYDPLADFVPVSRAVVVQFGLAVKASLPAENLAGYVAWVKSSSPKPVYGSPAIGSAPHFVGFAFGAAAGLNLSPVAYKGNVPLINDLVGGHIDAGVVTVGDMVEHHRNRRLRVLATAGKARSSALPDVPTFAEAGYPSVLGEEWCGVFAPKGTPAAIVAQYESAVRAAVQVQSVRERFLSLGWIPDGSSAQDLAQSLRNDLNAWRDLVARSGYVPED